MQTFNPMESRPLNFRFWAGVPLAIMAVMLLAEPVSLDFMISRQFYSDIHGFIGKGHYSWFFENLLHDRAKQAVIAIGVLAIAAFILSLLPTRLRLWRRYLGYTVLALGISTAIVTPLKELTAVHCPWNLQAFGGEEVYTALLEPRAPTLKPGRCWPGGHASAGFSLLALYFALRDRRPRAARLAFVVALTLGGIFSLGRVAQGAHFLSHNVWALLFDWMICLLLYRRPLKENVLPREDIVMVSVSAG